MTRKTATPKGKLEVKNFQVLKQIDLALTKNLIVIGGGNAQGKTSVLRAIHVCVVGKRAVEGKGSPVRDGEKDGSVYLSLGDIEIVRTFDGKDRWDVTLRRSGKVETSKVQDRLDALVSKTTFEPSFLWDSKIDEKTRTKMFLEAAGVDFSDIEAKRKELYDERTDVGREVKRLKGWLDQNPLDFDAPDELMDHEAVVVEFRNGTDTNVAKAKSLETIQRRHDYYSDLKEKLNKVREKIVSLRAQETSILEEGKAYRAETETLTTQAEQMPEVDTVSIMDKMNSITSHNEAYRAGQTRKQYGAECMQAEARWDNLTKEIEMQDAEKQAKLAAAKLPLEGLTATEEGIFLKGHPISRASGRDRLTVALAIALANMDKDFRLICCDGGEQFDPEWLPHIEQMAEEAGAMVILTRVSKDAACTVIMQDGRILSEEAYVAESPELPVSDTDSEEDYPLPTVAEEVEMEEMIQAAETEMLADPEDWEDDDTMSTGVITGYDEDVARLGREEDEEL